MNAERPIDEPLPEPQEPLVYHYCSMPALFGILSSSNFRLSQFRYANDSAEGHWAFKVAAEEFRKFAKTIRPHSNRDVQEGYQRFVDDTNAMLLSRQDASWFLNVFCGCFSHSADSLSQWRAYADDGRGAAIGVRLSFLKELPHYRYSLSDIIYDVGQLRDKLSSSMAIAFADVQSMLSEPLKHVPEEAAAARALRLIDDLQEFAYFAKNPAFAEELEIRLRYYPTMDPERSRLGFFERNGVIVPHYELPLIDKAGRFAIDRIIFGPKNQFRENVHAVQMLTSSRGHGLAYDQLYRSKASYR